PHGLADDRVRRRRRLSRQLTRLDPLGGLGRHRSGARGIAVVADSESLPSPFSARSTDCQSTLRIVGARYTGYCGSVPIVLEHRRSVAERRSRLAARAGAWRAGERLLLLDSGSDG